MYLIIHRHLLSSTLCFLLKTWLVKGFWGFIMDVQRRARYLLPEWRQLYIPGQDSALILNLWWVLPVQAVLCGTMWGLDRFVVSSVKLSSQWLGLKIAQIPAPGVVYWDSDSRKFPLRHRGCFNLAWRPKNETLRGNSTEATRRNHWCADTPFYWLYSSVIGGSFKLRICSSCIYGRFTNDYKHIDREVDPRRWTCGYSSTLFLTGNYCNAFL